MLTCWTFASNPRNCFWLPLHDHLKMMNLVSWQNVPPLCWGKPSPRESKTSSVFWQGSILDKAVTVSTSPKTIFVCPPGGVYFHITEGNCVSKTTKNRYNWVSGASFSLTKSAWCGFPPVHLLNKRPVARTLLGPRKNDHDSHSWDDCLIHDDSTAQLHPRRLT